jgi:hypothetical protein
MSDLPVIHYRDVGRRVPPVIELVSRLARLPYEGEELLLAASSMFGPSLTAQSMMYSMVNFARSGAQSFVVGSRLQEMLANTSLSKVGVDELHLPYQGFYVAFPASPWKVWGGDRTGWHDLSGVYVTTTDSKVDGVRRIMFFVWGNDNELSTHAGDDASVWFNVDMDRAQKHRDVESYVLDMMTNDEGLHFEIEGCRRPEIQESSRELAVNVVRIVFNLAQYLSSEGAEAEARKNRQGTRQRARLAKKFKKAKGPRKKALQEQLDRLGTLGVVTFVGPSIEKSYQESSRKASGRTVRRHWVRGHWKMVRFGPRDEAPSYRRKWLQPYERGEGEMVPSRDYHVEDPKDGNQGG